MRPPRLLIGVLLVAGLGLLLGGVALQPGLAARWASADGELRPATLRSLAGARRTCFFLAGGAGVLAAGVALWQRRGGAGLARVEWLVRRLLLAGAAALATAGLLEGVLRLLPASQSATPDDFLRYTRHYWAQVEGQLNGEGFRDREFPQQADAREYRVLVVGDSFVFGYGLLQPGEAFAQQLEAAADGPVRSPPVRTFNAGRSGTDTGEQLAILRPLLPRLAPQLVVLGYHENDVETRECYLEFLRAQNLVPLVSPVLQRHSRLWAHVETAGRALLVRLRLQDDYLGHLRKLFAPGHPAWRRQQRTLRELAQLVQASGARLAVVMFPLLESLGDYPLREEHRRVREVLAAEGVPVLDLLEVLAGRDAADLWVSPLDHHLGAAALAQAARATREFLDAHALLPAPPGRATER